MPTPARVLRVGFLLCADFTLVAFSAFMDTLRLAADEGDRSRPILCKWDVLGHDMTPVRSSAGVEVRPDKLMGSPHGYDYIVVVGGLLQSQRLSKTSTEFLLQAATQGIPLVGLCTGSFVLARLGLMTGVRCCVSWFHHEAFAAEFPSVPVTSEVLYVVEQNRLTCAGGTSVVHLAAHIIQRFAGKAPADKALRILIESNLSTADAVQPVPLYSQCARDSRVRRAMLLIERNIENPISCSFVARQVGLSVRQLERLFKSEIDLSPSAYAERLRLARAMDMLKAGSDALHEIALRCGYTTHSHFSARFRRIFGISPSTIRSGTQVP